MDDLREYLHKLREDFSKGVLNEADVDPQPSLQFKLWIGQAAETRIPEVQAMNLCSVSAEGKPSSRIVYLREFGNDNYCFYTNYNSKKAVELALNPNASLTFFWPQLERQIRIEGRVERAEAKQSDAYFNLRPYESRIGAWASKQSNALASRAELEQEIATLKKRFTPETIRRPEFWGGLVLKATYYEFWQGRKSRLHDRICYTPDKHGWKISRLSP